MRKLLPILRLSTMALGGFGQGFVNFQNNVNNPSTLISAQSGEIEGLIAGPVGSYYFALLISTNATSGFEFTGTYATNTERLGRFGRNGVAVPGWLPGQSMFYEVAGWSSSLGTTFDSSWLTNPPAGFGLSAVGSGVPTGPDQSLPVLQLFGGANGIQTGFVISGLSDTGTIAMQPQDFIYWSNQGAITIAGYTGPGGAVTIPDTINALPVTSVGPYSFSNATNLTSVTIPASVVTIGTSAFAGCGLSSVVIPSRVTTLGVGAFSYCRSLTNVVIGDHVLTIGEAAFASCTSLSNVTIPISVTSIDNGAFEYCSALSIAIIGNGVTNIGWLAFQNCGLTNAIIGNSVKSIGNFAFYQCHQLASIGSPSGVATIGDNAFSECFALTSIRLPSILRIGSDAFAFCGYLTNVDIGERAMTIGDRAFRNSPSLGIYFEGNAPGIGSAVFAINCSCSDAVYYLPGTSGWGTNFGGLPTAWWVLPNPLILKTEPNFGVGTNGVDFTVSWATNTSVVVEGCTNLVKPFWLPLQTNSFTGGTFHFNDAERTKYPSRFYRIRSL